MSGNNPFGNQPGQPNQGPPNQGPPYQGPPNQGQPVRRPGSRTAAAPATPGRRTVSRPRADPTPRTARGARRDRVDPRDPVARGYRAWSRGTRWPAGTVRGVQPRWAAAEEVQGGADHHRRGRAGAGRGRHRDRRGREPRRGRPGRRRRHRGWAAPAARRRPRQRRRPTRCRATSRRWPPGTRRPPSAFASTAPDRHDVLDQRGARRLQQDGADHRDQRARGRRRVRLPGGGLLHDGQAGRQRRLLGREGRRPGSCATSRPTSTCSPRRSKTLPMLINGVNVRDQQGPAVPRGVHVHHRRQVRGLRQENTLGR